LPQLESDALAAREAKLGEDRARLTAELDELLGRQEERLRAWEGRVAEQEAALEGLRQAASDEEHRCEAWSMQGVRRPPTARCLQPRRGVPKAHHLGKFVMQPCTLLTALPCPRPPPIFTCRLHSVADSLVGVLSAKVAGWQGEDVSFGNNEWRLDL
jgi:hypothetical protein